MSDTDNPQNDAPDEGDDAAKDAAAEKDWRTEADKWKALARKHETQAKSNADAARKLAELEDADKTEIQRATDKAAAADRRAAEAEAKALRIEVAIDKAPEGMPLAQVRKLSRRLAGSSREELEADAVELFGDFAPDTGDDDADESDTAARRRPTERLRSGAVPGAEPEENDPRKLAAAVPRMY